MDMLDSKLFPEKSEDQCSEVNESDDIHDEDKQKVFK
jgi:hypothetical protein